jgi:hypothetical protein
MPGVPDPIYVAARRALLNALDALQPHLEALVLVGAQAVYLHAGEGDLAVAPPLGGLGAVAPAFLRTGRASRERSLDWKARSWIETRASSRRWTRRTTAR